MRFAPTCLALSLVLAPAALLPAADKAPDAAAKPAAAAAMPDEKAMAAMMEKLAAKGEAHKRLAALAGTFKVTAKCYMPGADQPMVSEGTNKNEIILDGRWLRSDFTGSMMGQSFTGLGLLGFDNSKNKYVGTWVDSMSTMIVQMEGTTDPAGTTLTMTCDSFCPINNKVVPFRYVWHLDKGNDAYSFEIFGPMPDGKETRMMEIVYTRAK